MLKNYFCDCQHEMINAKNYNISSIVIVKTPVYTFLSLCFTILVAPNKQFFNAKFLSEIFG